MDFANVHRRFIKNFSRIVAPLILMLETTDESISNETHSTQTKKQGILDCGKANSANNVNVNIKIFHLL